VHKRNAISEHTNLPLYERYIILNLTDFLQAYARTYQNAYKAACTTLSIKKKMYGAE
jgi:hypothetical protein